MERLEARWSVLRLYYALLRSLQLCETLWGSVKLHRTLWGSMGLCRGSMDRSEAL